MRAGQKRSLLHCTTRRNSVLTKNNIISDARSGTSTLKYIQLENVFESKILSEGLLVTDMSIVKKGKIEEKGLQDRILNYR